MAVTINDIKALIPDCDVEDVVLTGIIADSTTYIDNVFTGLQVGNTEKDAITKWFACHMVSCGPLRQTKREKLGDAEVEYSANNGTELESTTYGKMALTLDRWGKLRKAGKQAIMIKAVTSFK